MPWKCVQWLVRAMKSLFAHFLGTKRNVEVYLIYVFSQDGTFHGYQVGICAGM